MTVRRPAPQQQRVQGEIASKDVERRHAPSPQPSLDQLHKDLAAAAAALEALRRAPLREFRVEPNEAAWTRLSKAADKLLLEIRAARPATRF